MSEEFVPLATAPPVVFAILFVKFDDSIVNEPPLKLPIAPPQSPAVFWSKDEFVIVVNALAPVL